MILDAGDGDPAGDGAYRKPPGPAPHEGTVYTVAGSAGGVRAGSFDHPVMVRSLGVLGSLVLEVDGSRLDGRFLTAAGTNADRFTLLKLGSSAALVCPAAPRGGCRAPARRTASKLDLKAKTRKLTWRWKNGAATEKADFGDPTSDTDYAICVYDAVDGRATLSASAGIPAGGQWKDRRRGFSYSSATAAPDGIRRVVLKAGASGKAAVKVMGKGMSLPPLPPRPRESRDRPARERRGPLLGSGVQRPGPEERCRRVQGPERLALESAERPRASRVARG